MAGGAWKGRVGRLLQKSIHGAMRNNSTGTFIPKVLQFLWALMAYRVWKTQSWLRYQAFPPAPVSSLEMSKVTHLTTLNFREHECVCMCTIIVHSCMHVCVYYLQQDGYFSIPVCLSLPISVKSGKKSSAVVPRNKRLIFGADPDLFKKRFQN